MSTRSPKTKPLPPGQYCNLTQTLRTIAQLPDEQVRQWGLGYDWTQPAERTTVHADHNDHEVVVSGVVILDTQDPRLTELLLRPDMYVSRLGSGFGAYAEFLQQNKAFLEGISGNTDMLCATLSRALSLGNLQAASNLEAWLDQQSGYMAAASLYATVPQPGKASNARHLADCHLPRPQVEQVLSHMENYLYRNRAQVCRSSSLKTWDEFRRSWYHSQALVALSFGNATVFDCLHEKLGNAATPALLAQALAARRFDVVAQMAQRIRTQQKFDSIAVGNFYIAQVSSRNNYQSLAEEVASRLVDQPIDAAWQKTAIKLVQGAFAIPVDNAPLSQSIALLAQCSHKWPAKLVSEINKACPEPSPLEAAHLLVIANDATWNARAASILRDPTFIDAMFSIPLTAFIQGEIQSNPSWLEGRMAPLLAQVPPNKVAEYCTRWSLGNRAALMSLVERTRLEMQTPSATAPVRARRM